MTTVLLDSDVLYWWSSDSKRLSKSAARAISKADELAVASITWYELAWLSQHGRIKAPIPIRSWLEALSEQVRTAGETPAIGQRHRFRGRFRTIQLTVSSTLQRSSTAGC